MSAQHSAARTTRHPPTADVVTAYRRRGRRRLGFAAALALTLVGLAVAALLVGGSSFGVADSWTGLWGWLGPGTRTPDQELVGRIVWQLRMPRILMAVGAGIGLTIAGLLMQTILRNPLASPSTLGISAAASSGAATAIVLRSSVWSFAGELPYEYVIIVNAFVFAAACTAVIYALTKVQRVTPETIILLGVAMMFFFSALTALIQYVGDPDQIAELAYWMFGSLTKTTWTKLAVTTIVCAAAVMVAHRWMWDLNALTVDDDTAAAGGVNVARIRLRALILASLITAVIVSFLGPIGFIGLVAPHLGRILVGGDHRYLLPIASLIGAILLLAADTAARTVIAPRVIPVGIITAFVGVPILISLMLRRRTEHW